MLKNLNQKKSVRLSLIAATGVAALALTTIGITVGVGIWGSLEVIRRTPMRAVSRDVTPVKATGRSA